MAEASPCQLQLPLEGLNVSQADRQPSRAPGLTRRKFIAGASLVTAGGVAAGVGLKASDAGADTPRLPEVALPAADPALPSRQFAWGATLQTDQYGNTIAPTHDRLLMFDVIGRPTPQYARVLESTLRELEHTFPWGPSGLLFTAGWGPAYFRLVGTDSPIPDARALSDFELPAIDHYHLCLHLACDDEGRLRDIEAALVHGAALPGVHRSLSLASILSWRETRAGFTGAGLPAAHQHVGGIPPGDPVSASTPLFMGFKSNLKRNQATEDDVAITAGPYADGTTMHVSYMRLRLDSWYQDLGQDGRIARMYAPQVSPRQAAAFTTDAESDPQLLNQAIRRYGVIGHAQTSARARRKGRPIILRRDFNTVDGGQAGLHFVSVQRTIADFVTTRTAMNAASAQLENPAIGDTVNNGINEFIFVLKRANYIVPARPDRSFPMLPGRSKALV
jgi:hypothetical protein